MIQTCIKAGAIRISCGEDHSLPQALRHLSPSPNPRLLSAESVYSSINAKILPAEPHVPPNRNSQSGGLASHFNVPCMQHAVCQLTGRSAALTLSLNQTEPRKGLCREINSPFAVTAAGRSQPCRGAPMPSTSTFLTNNKSPLEALAYLRCDFRT